MADISSKPWGSFSAADYTPEQWKRATLIHLGDGPEKDQHKLPVREPDGTLNRNGLHAAAAVLAGARGGVQAPSDARRRAARSLVGLYRTAKMTPPDSLRRMAGA